MTTRYMLTGVTGATSESAGVARREEVRTLIPVERPGPAAGRPYVYAPSAVNMPAHRLEARGLSARGEPLSFFVPIRLNLTFAYGSRTVWRSSFG